MAVAPGRQAVGAPPSCSQQAQREVFATTHQGLLANGSASSGGAHALHPAEPSGRGVPPAAGPRTRGARAEQPPSVGPWPPSCEEQATPCHPLREANWQHGAQQRRAVGPRHSPRQCRPPKPVCAVAIDVEDVAPSCAVEALPPLVARPPPSPCRAPSMVSGECWEADQFAIVVARVRVNGGRPAIPAEWRLAALRARVCARSTFLPL